MISISPSMMVAMDGIYVKVLLRNEIKADYHMHMVIEQQAGHVARKDNPSRAKAVFRQLKPIYLHYLCCLDILNTTRVHVWFEK